MGTFDEFFLAFGPALGGMNTFVVDNSTNNRPVFEFGVGGLGRTNGVQGVVEVPQQPPTLIGGVYGSGILQPGVIGFSRENDGVEGASFTGTAVRAASFFGPGVHSISGALNGVTGISGTQGPPTAAGLPTTAGVLGSSNEQAGVIGTSNRTAGVLGFSNNVGVFGVGTNFAGVFQGNLVVTGTKSAAVPFPDGSQRALYCMESPEVWFEDFGAAKLKRGRAIVRLDSDFAKVIERRDCHVFLSPRGDCRGLYYVFRQGGASFEVRELAGGKSNVAFSYRIVGRRKDIRARRRFAKVDTGLPVPRAATDAARKRAPKEAEFRAFVARLEKEARRRGPKGAKRPKRIRTHAQANISALVRELEEEVR
jgi:hypothetical protein